MQTDLDTLKQKVLEAVQRSRLAALVEDIVIEPDRDGNGDPFLRVSIRVKGIDDEADDPAFESLLEEIENVVATVDERYPSVRFLDAA